MTATNWKLLAQIRSPHLSSEDLDRVAESLVALESAFAPLLADLVHETEPAFILSHPV